jgi:outer membrane lipoprotein-sorting protein
MTSRTALLAALLLGAALLGGGAPAGAAPTGAAAAFLATWAKIPSYTANIKVHETKGTDVQDRTYHYAYLKPHFARIDITGGPGRGGGAVWKGGDTVSGHQGGLLSGIHLTISIHDGRAVDLRGGTIDQASFDNVAENIKGAASETNGEETVNGTQYDTVTIPFKDANDATKRVIFLSRATHLPARRVTYAGDAVVLVEDFTDVNTAANLKESDF